MVGGFSPKHRALGLSSLAWWSVNGKVSHSSVGSPAASESEELPITCWMCHSVELPQGAGLRTGAGEGPKGLPFQPPSSVRCSSEA